jgi:hypothetical protein
VIDLRAEQGIEGVGVGIEVDTAHGPLGGDGPEDRKGDRVVAPGRDWHDTRGMQRGEKRLNFMNTVQEVERVLGASPTSATWQMSNGAMALEAFTRRIKRDISRIWAGP